MDALVGAGSVAATAENVGALPNAADCEEHFRPDGIAWTLRTAYQFQCEPMIFVFDGVAKKRGRRIDVVEHDVDVAVVE